MRNNIKIESEYVLAVEGRDEVEFFKALLKYEKITSAKIQIIDINGKDKFKRNIEILSKSDGFGDIQAIGFVRDAEKNSANSAFESICYILKNNHIPNPKNIEEIIESHDMKVGIFIMPDNENEGMLEDLCLCSVTTDPIYECMENYLECCAPYIAKNLNIPKAKLQAYEAPAKIEAYLAAKHKIVDSVGLGAQKKHWDFDHSCFDKVRYFLHQLFD